MKKITIVGYSYNELPEDAQQKLKKKIVHSWEYMDDFNWKIQDIIDNDFPNSDIKIQWSLDYCQGDGVNVYGILDYAINFYNNTIFTSSGTADNSAVIFFT